MKPLTYGGKDVAGTSNLLPVLMCNIFKEATEHSGSKAFCYEDIVLMAVYHPEHGQNMLVMNIKFSNLKQADRKYMP